MFSLITILIVCLLIFLATSSFLPNNIYQTLDVGVKATPTTENSDNDNFGIKKIYPTKGDGSEWYSAWQNGNDRELGFGERDPHDGIELTGDGSLTVNGKDGTATIVGKAPRVRVVDLDFKNVEITFYGMRQSETDDVSFQGFVVGARSKHYTDQECYANTYYGRFTYDGRVSFEKELFHGHGDNAYYPNSDEEPKLLWPDGVPRDTWIGLKFVLRTLISEEGEEDRVILELYRDLTDGRNGGHWEKVLEYTDIGEWYVDAKEGLCNDYPHNKILFTTGFVFIRNDFVDDAKYKKFSIREIE